MILFYIEIPVCTIALLYGLSSIARMLEALLVEIHKIAEDNK